MSSWLALRIYKSSHSNPIWAIVDKKPVRASKRSAEWCLKSVEQCWKQKEEEKMAFVLNPFEIQKFCA